MGKNISERKRFGPAFIPLWKAFCENVSIAGLRDVYHSETLIIRLIFIIGLLSAGFLSIQTSFTLVRRYVNKRPAVGVTFYEDGRVPFPNVTVCTTATFNASAARELIVIPDDLKRKLMTHGISQKQFIEAVIPYTELSTVPRPQSRVPLRYIAEAIDHTGGMSGSPADVIRLSMPSCVRTLSNCKYNDQSFDCCLNIVQGALDDYVCYGIPAANFAEVQVRSSFTKLKEMTVDIQMDWRHAEFMEREDATDGFLVIAGQPFTPFASKPVAVAPGWEASIRLSQPRLRSDISRCFDVSKSPKLQYMPYYDAHGTYCQQDIASRVTQMMFQCANPSGNYFPNKSVACGFRQGLATLTTFTGDISMIKTSGQYNERMEAEKAKYKNLVDKIHDCKPLCTRWQYEPIIGYSELRNAAGTLNANLSWSRISVSLADAYYEQHEEQAKPSVYILFCSIGAVLEACIGASIIAFAEVIMHGIHFCDLLRSRRKSRRVKPYVDKAPDVELSEM